MIVPSKIETLHELSKWVEKNKPEIIEIFPSSGLAKIKEFRAGGWERYRGIDLVYFDESLKEKINE